MIERKIERSQNKMNIEGTLLKQGCVDIIIDSVVPCLEEAETGLLKPTVVFPIRNRAFLREFNEDTGWRIDWSEIPLDVEVYALALKDTLEIQGLVGVRNDKAAHAAYLHWACTAPRNNKWEFGRSDYIGVGGHLFAIAADKSVEWGYGGLVFGFAANEDLLLHYIEKFEAEYIGIAHEYHFVIFEEEAKKLLEVYDYEWKEG